MLIRLHVFGNINNNAVQMMKLPLRHSRTRGGGDWHFPAPVDTHGNPRLPGDADMMTRRGNRIEALRRSMMPTTNPTTNPVTTPITTPMSIPMSTPMSTPLNQDPKYAITIGEVIDHYSEVFMNMTSASDHGKRHTVGAVLTKMKKEVINTVLQHM